MSKPAISVIVPVYNASRYLVRCVDSILAQSFTDFECLLINDGSTDDSQKICRKYEHTDSRIKVLDKANGGVGSARNMGIDNADGEWIAFVDSDDALKCDYLEVLYSNIDNVQMVCSYGTVMLPDYSHTCKHYQGLFKSDIVGNMFLLYGLRTNAAPWGKLFRTSIIRQNRIRFNEKMKIGEDMLFIIRYVEYVDSVNVVDNASYKYYVNASSLVRSVNSPSSEYYSYSQIKEACNSILDSMPDCLPSVIDEIKRMQSAYIRRVLNSLYYNDVTRSDRIRIITSLDTSLFCQYVETDSLWGRFCIVLLRYRLVLLYDLFRSIVSSCRKITSKKGWAL